VLRKVCGVIFGWVLLPLLILEGGLRLFSPFPIHDVFSNQLPHAELGYVVDRRHLPDVGASGFRDQNQPLARAPLVTLGDSHTFAGAADYAHTWPAVLAKSLTGDAYQHSNLSAPSYGVTEFPALLAMALTKRPRWIVLGLYLDNDLESFCPRIRDRPLALAFATEQRIPFDQCPPTVPPQRHWYDRVALISFVRYHAVEWLTPPVRGRLLLNDPLGTVPITMGGRDISIARSWLAGVGAKTDPATPTVRLGRDFLLRWLPVAEQQASAAGAEFWVFAIPSRIRVVCLALTEQQKQLPPELRRACQQEQALLAELQKLPGLKVVDGGPPMAAAAARGDGIYPNNLNSHPEQRGQVLYGQAIAAGMQALRDQAQR
jgi:hypothetical protein